MTDTPVLRSQVNCERRQNFVNAARDGVLQMAAQYGAVVLPTKDGGFCVVFPNDDRIYFDTIEL